MSTPSDKFEARLPEIAAFVRAKLPGVAKWPDGRLEDWLRWFWQHGWLCVVTDPTRGVLGVGAARPVRDGMENDRTAYDMAGDTTWVDLAVSGDRRTTAALWTAMLLRVGRRTWIGFHRAARHDEACRYPFDKFAERILA